jgi:phospholipid/cholesterol/gamma-HCH transport system substrate-binding protein
VELDEALAALDDRSMTSLRSLAGTLARGARDPATPQRVNATLGELDTLTGELRRLTGTLKGQEATITAAIQDSRAVLGELGRREAKISQIVSAGSATLGAMASRQAQLDAGLHELPALLTTARETLSAARPLLADARPLARDLRAAAPVLTPAIEDLRPVARDAANVLAGLPRLRTVALPVLDRAERVVGITRPAARALEPALANLVPIVRYLAPRKRTLAAWFSQTAALGKQGDAKGRWARFNIFVDPQTALGVPGGLQRNSYTGPDDAEANKPHRPGTYSRLTPFKP